MQEIHNTSHQHRCIFIHVPKTAGTSIKNALNMPGGGHAAWVHYAFCYPKIWRQYTSFAVVRNPWDRVVSAYHFARMKESYWHTAQRRPPLDYQLLADKSFEECLMILYRQRHLLKSESWVEQTYWIARPPSMGSKVMVDRVLRWENLDTEFAEFCAQMRIDPKTVPTLSRVNCSNRSTGYRQYYNSRTRKLVELLYTSDIETFGYSF